MAEGYILIVDDDEDIRNMVGIYLENEGLSPLKCGSAAQVPALLEKNRVDLILLDIMMPGPDGIQTCLRVRETSNIPIIFLTARATDMDKIQGLAVGADDYITKPFNPMELVARVKAQLRRYRKYNGSAGTEPLRYQDLLLDRVSRQLWRGGEEIRLTPKEFDILELLMRNKGLTLSARQIYEGVWHEEYLEKDNTVLMHISNLRDKLEHTRSQYIKTVWGVGYRL